MPTTEADVLWFLDRAVSVGVPAEFLVVVGGWGIDALMGIQTREHRDLDLLVPEDYLGPLVADLRGSGFLPTTDWRPVRIELSEPASGRHLDIHLAHPDGAGGWWQHGLNGARHEYPAEMISSGQVGGRTVACLGPARQRELHSGYDLRAVHRHDLANLDTLRSAPAVDGHWFG